MPLTHFLETLLLHGNEGTVRVDVLFIYAFMLIAHSHFHSLFHRQDIWPGFSISIVLQHAAAASADFAIPHHPQMQFPDTAANSMLRGAPSVCVILGEHRSVARTFTVKLCPDVSGLSCAMVVNTGWRFAGGCAIFYAERRLRLSLYPAGQGSQAEKSFCPGSIKRRSAPADTYSPCAKLCTDLILPVVPIFRCFFGGFDGSVELCTSLASVAGAGGAGRGAF